ncbi:MAG: hypothetical protein ACI37Z_02610 [Candidatus Gastranaerophilaceae bacterium]
MITLDVNLAYLIKNYKVNTKRINEAGLTTIDEFMEAEAAQGNKSAVSFENEVFNDPQSILELFQLTSPKNRFLILKNLNTNELQYLMQFLGDKELYNSLKFLSQEKLMKMVSKLPKEKLATIVFNSFSVKNFLKVTQEKEMNKFFESPKLEKNDILKAVEGMEPEKLQSMMELLTGQVCQHCDAKEVQEKMAALDDKKFMRTLQAFNPETKAALITNMTKENPDYLLEFSNEALMKPLTQLQKPDFIKTLAVLDPKDHLELLSELPDDIMPLVVTQIDPEVFAKLLATNFKDILKEISL